MEESRHTPLVFFVRVAIFFLVSLTAVFGIVAGILTLLWLCFESWWKHGTGW
jgi:hypothetical protein